MDDVKIEASYIKASKREYEDSIETIRVDTKTKEEILAFMDAEWVRNKDVISNMNPILVAAAYVTFLKSHKNPEEIGTHLRNSYSLISHFCPGKDKEKVIRSILRYYYYIRDCKGL